MHLKETTGATTVRHNFANGVLKYILMSILQGFFMAK